MITDFGTASIPGKEEQDCPLGTGFYFSRLRGRACKRDASGLWYGRTDYVEQQAAETGLDLKGAMKASFREDIWSGMTVAAELIAVYRGRRHKIIDSLYHNQKARAKQHEREQNANQEARAKGEEPAATFEEDCHTRLERVEGESFSTLTDGQLDLIPILKYFDNLANCDALYEKALAAYEK